MANEKYPAPGDTEGKLIYKEAGIQVNTHPRDTEGHNIWINGKYFLFPRGILSQTAERQPVKDLTKLFTTFNSNILFTLEEEGISVETFALVLSRARIKELEEYASYLVQRE